MNRAIVRRFAAAGCALLLSDAALAGGETSPRPLAFFTLMSDHGPVARAIMDGGDACPVLATKGNGDGHGDGKTIAMAMRAEPANLPLRPTKSTIENSKPSRFPVRFHVWPDAINNDPAPFLADAATRQLVRDTFSTAQGVEIAVWVKNLTDQYYRTNIFGMFFNRSTGAYPSERCTFGVSAAYRF